MVKDLEKRIEHAKEINNQVELKAFKNLKDIILNNSKETTTEDKQYEIAVDYARKIQSLIFQLKEAHIDNCVKEYTDELNVLKEFLRRPVNVELLYDSLLDWCISEKICPIKVEYVLMPNGGKAGVNIHGIPENYYWKAIKYLKIEFPLIDDRLIMDIIKDCIIK
jgi:hypothetical protein